MILSPPPARIFEGKITYEDTRQPVARARVRIDATVAFPSSCIMNMAGQTDAEGHFRLNPYSGKIFFISVSPPDGEPYLGYEKEIKLSDGQPPPQIEIALPRGVLLRGKIADKASGEPVAGATVQYEDQSRPIYRPDRLLPDSSPPRVLGVSRADGTYQIAVPPGHGTLFVQGPGNDYIRQTINTRDYNKNASCAQRHYVSAYASLDLKPNQEPAELSLAIRRGAAVQGRIVGPQDRPVGDVLLLSRHFVHLGEDTFRGLPIVARDGQFALHGLDPETGVPFYFLDPKNELGVAVDISGKSGAHGPFVVHLQPCGKAVARFVTPAGKPRAKYRPNFSIIALPGPSPWDFKHAKRQLVSDEDFVANFDRQHYWEGPVTNDEGRCTFPALIPGARYRINLMNNPGDWDERDFTARSGETVQLPDIVVSEPDAAKATDPSGKSSTAKPADETSSDSDQSAARKAANTESKPLRAHPLVAAPNTAEARAIAEIEKLGGRVWALEYENSPGKPVTIVNLIRTNLTDAGLVNLNDLPRLVHLDLPFTQVTDAGLVHLEGLTQLEMLNLVKDNITDTGLEHLKGLTQLHDLFLGYTKISDAGLAKLKGLTQLESLDLSGTRVTDAGLDHLKGLTHLQTLFLAETPITGAGLAKLNGLTNLQSLQLANTQVTDAGLASLKGLIHLRELKLGKTQVTGAGLANLNGLTNLQSVDLEETQVTDAGLANLKGLTHLRALKLSKTKVTDAGLANLSGLTKLQSLDVGNTQVTAAGLANLKALTDLQTLNLREAEVTAAGLANLKGLIQLQHLDLSVTRTTDAGLANLKGLIKLQWLGLAGTQVTDTGLEHLKGLKQLQDLFLYGTQVTDAGLANLNGLPNLRALGLAGTQVTDAGLANLKGCTKLGLLDVAETKVTDAGLANLKGFAGLYDLVLSRTKVTDAGLVQLEGLTKLQYLLLSGTQISDAGLEHLKGLTKLRRLFLGGTRVTDAGVKKLQQALPHCKIDRSSPPAVKDSTSTIPNQGKISAAAGASPDSAVPKANDQSSETSSKPAAETPPASRQSATKEGAEAESKPAPTPRHLTAAPAERVIGERPRGNCSISGSVVSAATDTPIGHARMYLHYNITHGSIFINTTGDGTFNFQDIPNGPFSLQMSHTPGYQDVSYNPDGKAGQFPPFSLKDGEHRSGIVLKAQQSCRVSGKILGENGKIPENIDTLSVLAWFKVDDGEQYRSEQATSIAPTVPTRLMALAASRFTSWQSTGKPRERAMPARQSTIPALFPEKMRS